MLVNHGQVTTAGELWMWGMKLYLSPKKFDCPEPIKSISCGSNFTVAIGAETGSVYTFGNGNTSCLGHGKCQRTMRTPSTHASARTHAL